MSSTGVLRLIIICLAAYMIGNINPAIILGKIKGIDIRKEGSGNAGMTNTIRVMGLGAGITVFIVDVLKGFVAVTLGYSLGSTYGAMAAFAGVVLGHCFPVVFGFKGGKGVASAFGAALALNWISALAALLIAGVLFGITRRMSIASLAAALAYPVLVWHFKPEYFYFAICAAAFLMIMHLANIKRIAKGEEKPLTIGGGNKEEKEQTK
ncbi:MAG: glycerol-3-phosphate 1-O-acyltransferase PlsY [Mogibacterium sp.]|nr:glycerol-3-phosphate 1-O-acyltransferase PlsY [Mogibacterium sp.]MBQ6502119.1 glycerol-3-phosphate 1-O-acyltransferase PlsY [Mogibacterium sp.]